MKRHMYNRQIWRDVLLIGILWCLLGMTQSCHATDWEDLQNWVDNNVPGAKNDGNNELTSVEGTMTPLRTNADTYKFLFSDNPEKIETDALNKGLTYMSSVTAPDVTTNDPVRLGVVLYHTNGTSNSMVLHVVFRFNATTGTASVSRTRGAYGTCRTVRNGGTDPESKCGQICANHWFTLEDDIQSGSKTLTTTDRLFSTDIPVQPDITINAMLKFYINNSKNVSVFVTVGNVDLSQPGTPAWAAKTSTATQAGWGYFWKRKLTPIAGSEAIAATNTDETNEKRLRFKKENCQLLTDDTGRNVGGMLKGDYNVEYNVSVFAKRALGSTSNGRLGVIVNVQQDNGYYWGGGIRMNNNYVDLPSGNYQIRAYDQGAMIDKYPVTLCTDKPFYFTWMLPGGSFAEDDFVYVPY